jgi:hypothetical protein
VGALVLYKSKTDRFFCSCSSKLLALDVSTF